MDFQSSLITIFLFIQIDSGLPTEKSWLYTAVLMQYKLTCKLLCCIFISLWRFRISPWHHSKFFFLLFILFLLLTMKILEDYNFLCSVCLWNLLCQHNQSNNNKQISEIILNIYIHGKNSARNHENTKSFVCLISE